MNERTEEILRQMHNTYRDTKKDANDLTSFGGDEVPVVHPEETKLAAETYFQVIILKKLAWVPVNGSVTLYEQYGFFQLKTVPQGTHVVTELLLENDEENDPVTKAEYEELIEPVGVTGCMLKFHSNGRRPICNFTIGLKLIADSTGEIVIPDETCLFTKEELKGAPLIG